MLPDNVPVDHATCADPARPRTGIPSLGDRRPWPAPGDDGL